MTSIVLFELFQSLGTVQLVPDVRKMTVSAAIAVCGKEAIKTVLAISRAVPIRSANCRYQNDKNIQ
jgi:hypothetical protein